MSADLKRNKVIHTALLNGNAPVRDLAKTAGLTDQQFRRELQGLQKEGVISPYTLINQFLLGWQKAGVYFDFSSISPDEIDKALSELILYENVVSVVELLGRYQYFMALNIVSIHEYDNFMKFIAEKIPSFKISESVSFRRSLTLFKRKYLLSEKADGSSLSYHQTEDVIDLDDGAIEILNFIFVHGGFPNALEISQATGIPHSTVHNKIKGLEKKGVIVGYTYSVDPYKLGFFSYDLLIKSAARSESFKKKLTQFCAQHPYVIGLTESVGCWQYEVRVEAPTPSAANRTSQELLAKFDKEIEEMEIVSVCRELKYMRTPQIRNHPPLAGNYSKSKNQK